MSFVAYIVAFLIDSIFAYNHLDELYVLVLQMQLAASSCVMIGVQGAGLQWSVFMPDGCTLIEIAWPSKHWGFHFNNYVKPYGIVHFGLRANARVNWAAYEKNVRNGKKVTDE